MNNIKISDYIKIDDIPGWKNQVVTISAQTGAGKSYFIKNTLYDYAKANGQKILMLIHRLNCIEQFTMELEQDEEKEKERKLDIIDIRTYQSNEYCSLPKDFNFNDYDYIVCDEFHYFLSDSVFNQRTDVSLERILAVENVTKIFLSATSRNMKMYIADVLGIVTKDYEYPYDYSFINNLTFYYGDSIDYLEEYIEHFLDSGEKAIFFVQSATKGYELHKKYNKSTLYNCGKSDLHYKYVDKERITQMLNHECFDEQILITTTCLEAGVNLKDTELKHIVLDVEDVDVLQQCIGRKRIQSEADKVNLYIHATHNKKIGGKITQLKATLRPAQYLLYNGSIQYAQKYSRGEQSTLIYDEVSADGKIVKKVNKVMFHKKICDIELYEKMIKQGYCKYLSKLFDNKKYLIEEKIRRSKELKPLLEEMEHKKLNKKEIEILIQALDVRAAGRQQRAYKKLNHGLEWLGLPYVIIPKRTKHQRYWILERIDD